MKRFSFFTLLLCAVSTLMATNAYSQDINKDKLKAFRNAKEYRLVVDMTRTTYSGLDSLEFIKLKAPKSNLSEAEMGASLKRVGTMLEKGLSKRLRANVSCNARSSVQNAIEVQIDEITEHAGISATVTLVLNGSPIDPALKVYVNDGKWNTFDVLLDENMESFTKKLSRRIYGFPM